MIVGGIASQPREISGQARDLDEWQSKKSRSTIPIHHRLLDAWPDLLSSFPVT
jgi:hypothetical protein